MAVKIRLKRMGSKKKPFYRIIATDSRNPRDGRFIETLGYYNPLTDPPQIKVDEENIFKWLERGAIPSANTESILKQTGSMQKWQLLKQGVKREEIDERLEAIGVRTAPEPAPALKPEPAETAEKEEAQGTEAGGAESGDQTTKTDPGEGES